MRLLTTFGLVIAFFFTSNSFASIYDVAPYLPPKQENIEQYAYSTSAQRFESLPLALDWVSSNLAPSFLASYAGRDPYLLECSFDSSSSSQNIPLVLGTGIWGDPLPSGRTVYCWLNAGNLDADGNIVSRGEYRKEYSTLYRKPNIASSSCPPDSNINYNFEYDSNSDGKIDKCFDPSVLLDLTNCSAAPDFLANSSGQTGDICLTQSDGQQCGYLAGSNGSMVKSSSVQCYDPFTPVDEFGNDNLPNVEPDQCTAFGSGFVCSADPAKICSGGVCPSQCGTVKTNNVSQFVCFNDTPNLPNKTDPTDPTNDLDPTIDDPNNPDTVNPTDPNNPVSQDLATTNNRLGDLIQLTRDKGNDMIYAINKQTGQVVGSIGETNQTLKSIEQKLSNPSGDLVAAVDRSTGEIISVMRESQVKLGELGDNIILTKDIQQGLLTATNETKDEIVRGFDNVIEFMKSVDTPDPETGESDMDRLLKTNSDGFAQVQTLLDQLLTMPGIESAGGSGLPTDPETGEEVAPNPADFSFDAGLEQQRLIGAFDTTQVDADILLIKQNLSDTFKQLNGSFKEVFSVSVSSNAALPSLGVIEYNNSQTDVSLEPYSEQMNMIGLALLFMTTVSCLVIIFR